MSELAKYGKYSVRYNGIVSLLSYFLVVSCSKSSLIPQMLNFLNLVKIIFYLICEY